jgi:hypothetical protein
MKESPAQVYLMFSPSEDIYKIGYTSQDLAIRTKYVRWARCVEDICPVHSIKCCDMRLATDVEYLLHYAYRAQRVYGEWFKLLPENVATIRKFHLGSSVLQKFLPIWYTDIMAEEKKVYTELERRWLSEYKTLLDKPGKPLKAIAMRQRELSKSAQHLEKHLEAIRREMNELQQLYQRFLLS